MSLLRSLSARRACAVATALVLALTVAGCSGVDTEVETNADGLTVLNVALIPEAGVAPIYLGNREGFFREEGLDVRPVISSGGAALLPAVLKGDMHIGWVNPVTLLLATNQGIALRALASGQQATDPALGLENTDSRGFDTVSVPADSPIRTAADLNGKVIGVASLNSIVDLMLKASIDAHGGDSSTVEVIEIAGAEQAIALEQGRIDAAKAAEPFSSALADAGARTILSPYTDVVPGLQNSIYATTPAFADANPEVVAAFQRAIDKSMRFAQQNPDAAREIVPTYTKLTPEVAGRITLPYWGTEINWAAVDSMVDLMQRYGMTDSRPDPAKIER